MFNLFPSFQKLGWLTDTGYTIDDKSYSSAELMHEFIKLRQENTQLKAEIENWKVCSVKWKEVYNEKADYVDELVKEVNGLRHLKKENVELMERVNEIEVLKKEKKESFEILKKAIEDESARFYELVVESTNDEINLKAANKEIEALKCKLRDYQDKYAKSFSYEDIYKLEKEIEQLKRWKKEQLTVQSWWDKVDSYVRDHDDAPLGGIVANTCLNFLKERDELKAEVEKLKSDIVDYVIEKDDEINELKKTQDWNDFKRPEKYHECNHCGYKVAHNSNQWGGCGCCKEGLMIEKEEEQKQINEVVETLKNMKTQGFEDYDPSDFEEQKHPIYPIHWGGQKEVEFNAEELLERVTEYAETTAENLEEKFDKGEDVLDYFEKPEWRCPCNKCKDKRENAAEKSWEEAASDLALKIIKLEKQIEELKIVNTTLCQKPS